MAIAEFERSIIQERVAAGLKAAKGRECGYEGQRHSTGMSSKRGTWLRMAWVFERLLAGFNCRSARRTSS